MLRGSGSDQGAWWLGRAIGLALVLTLGVAGWASTHDVTTPPSAVPLDDEVAAVSAPVPVASRTPIEQLPVIEPAVPRTADASRPRPRPRPAEEQVRAPSQDRALQAEAARKRESARIRREIRSDRELAAFIASVEAVAETELWVAPLQAAYRITATFGQAGRLWSKDHTGLDMAAPTGTPIAAVAAGTVTHAGTAGAYGSKVEITHADGSETWYAHLSTIAVTTGQLVEKGATIGAVGATGNVTGPHLHLEFRPDGGVPVDPVRALAARGVAL